MTRKLYSQYEEKLQEAQRKHSAEKEVLLVRVCCLKHNTRDVASRFSQKLKGVMRLDIKRSQGVHSFIHSFIHIGSQYTAQTGLKLKAIPVSASQSVEC